VHSFEFSVALQEEQRRRPELRLESMGVGNNDPERQAVSFGNPAHPLHYYTYGLQGLDGEKGRPEQAPPEGHRRLSPCSLEKGATVEPLPLYVWSAAMQQVSKVKVAL
jgi:hypothetical protein